VSLVAFSAFEATFSLLTEARFSLSESATYFVFFLIGIGLVLVQGGFVHPVVVALGERRTAQLGLAANGVGLALLAFDGGWWLALLAFAGGWWLASIALVLLVVGQGLAAPALASLVGRYAGEGRRGETFGLQHAAGGVARSIGPAMGGALFGYAIAGPYVAGA